MKTLPETQRRTPRRTRGSSAASCPPSRRAAHRGCRSRARARRRRGRGRRAGARRSRRSGSTNCGKNARKKSAVFGLRMFTTAPCRNSFPVGAARISGSPGSTRGHERPDAEKDQVGGARVLDDVERDRRGHDQRGQADRGGGDVDERAEVDAEHRHEPRRPALLDAAGDDVEHRRSGHEQQRNSRDDEHPSVVGVGDHELSFSRTRSLTTFGFALPWVSRITAPTKKPSRPSLPPR